MYWKTHKKKKRAIESRPKYVIIFYHNILCYTKIISKTASIKSTYTYVLYGVLQRVPDEFNKRFMSTFGVNNGDVILLSHEI